MLRRFVRFWTPLRVMDASILLGIVFVVVWELHPTLIFSSTIITGGDTGSHLALPAYLRTQGNLFDFTPWYPGWFAGMPAYSYYFVLPDILATWASYLIGFAVAMKLATILGSLLMPFTAYAMGRLFRAPRPIPIALALATLPFLFDASFTIDGGNLFSTMAGEYAFSLSLALSLLAIGLFARGIRTGKGYWRSAICLSLVLAAHILPWFFTIIAVAVLVIFELLARRGIGDPDQEITVRGDYARPLRFAAGAGLLSLALSAWWLAPFLTSQGYTNSLGYSNDPVNTLHEIFTTLGWFSSAGGHAGDRWVISLAGVAVIVAFVVRDRLGMVLATLVVLSLLAFVYEPQSVIWNERLVPFWFVSIHLIAGWLFAYPLSRWAKRRRKEPLADPNEESVGEGWSGVDQLDDHEERRLRRTVNATVAMAVLGFASTVPGLIAPVASALSMNTTGNQVAVWANTNYSGYQAQSGWPEYQDLISTLKSVAKRYGCGRAMWEYNSSEQRFGTPEALMLLPYWTNNCVDSMEGLLFESSATTPYHFLDQAELSASPSDAQANLPYGSLDVLEGVEHLQMLGVKYYIGFSPEVISQAASDPALKLVATTKAWPSPGVKWYIYKISDSPVVEPLTSLPNVVAHVTSRVEWLNANVTWWLDSKDWDVLVASSGPANWPTATGVDDLRASAPLPKVKVTDVRVGTQSISFHVSRVGAPVEVKISYFPRWHATGATGPYRVSPNMMAVIPTSKNVTLVYGSTPALEIGNAVTDLAVFSGFVTLWFVSRRRRKVRQ
ncbi:MAG TPA: hypothetical protein VGE75_05920 [Acidimicrobiales bacterium]